MLSSFPHLCPPFGFFQLHAFFWASCWVLKFFWASLKLATRASSAFTGFMRAWASWLALTVAFPHIVVDSLFNGISFQLCIGSCIFSVRFGFELTLISPLIHRTFSPSRSIFATASSTDQQMLEQVTVSGMELYHLQAARLADFLFNFFMNTFLSFHISLHIYCLPYATDW